jgi:hypothetical protein
VDESSAEFRGRYRWVVCALLFFATTINYMDRQVLGILAPTLQKEIHWTEAQYGQSSRGLLSLTRLDMSARGADGPDRDESGFLDCRRDLESFGDGTFARAKRQRIQYRSAGTRRR